MPSLAQEKKQKNKAAARLTYLKKDKNEVYFSVEIRNPTGNKFAIAIDDEDGKTLFKSAYSKRKFNRVFKAPLLNGRLTVLVSNEKQNSVVGYFEISSEAPVIDEVLMSRL